MGSRGRKRPNPAASPPASSPRSFPATSGYRLPSRAWSSRSQGCHSFCEGAPAAGPPPAPEGRGTRLPGTASHRTARSPLLPAGPAQTASLRLRQPTDAVPACDGLLPAVPRTGRPALPCQGGERGYRHRTGPFPLPGLAWGP